MPKDRSTRAVSYERRRSRASPYSSHGKGCSRRSEESAAAAAAAAAKQAAEWEDVRCPVCMDHPHNAVMLVCSSHEKGCRPFMCDTSYRHSNCFDQYRKASKDSSKDTGASAASAPECSECQQPIKLSCPLCRGPVSHWTKDYDARKYMNAKVRACTKESCEFRGAYSQLRRHARENHPTVRPTQVDPDRQRDWHRMEQQRDLGDLFSMLRSGLSAREDGIGVSEGEEDINERTLHSPSITMVFIVRTGRSILHYREAFPGHHRRRTILLLGEAFGRESSPLGGASGSGDADTTGRDNDEGDDDVTLSTEAAGSQHDVGEVDGDPAH
ncbi:uncharacterized protein LOC102708475 [Oryza brachyantha]|uniref:Uncharacterized protein n=1 Tax=Oryza brachyantha TaxID=4533 RepID=J3L1U5_ORYBR|nr:uncharacterized protein LOC102708475 [Oryza brachyantha]